MRKKVLLIGAAAVAATLAGGWALAQSYGPGYGPPWMHGEGPGGRGPGMMHQMGPGMGAGMGPGMMHGHRGVGSGMRGPGGPGSAFADPAQIEKLKSELAITPAQEPVWTKYTKTIQDAAAAMKTARESVDPATVGTMSPQDRYAFMTKMREQGQKQFETVHGAADELFKTLDDGQKAKALDLLPGFGFGPGPMRAAGAGGRFHHRW